MPGVVLLDEALHAIAAETGLALERCTITTVKFRSIVRPGQRLLLQFKMTAPGSVQFELESDGHPVASGRLAVAAMGSATHAH